MDLAGSIGEEGALGGVGLDREGLEAKSAIERIPLSAVIDLVGEDGEGNAARIGAASAILTVAAVMALGRLIRTSPKHKPALEPLQYFHAPILFRLLILAEERFVLNLGSIMDRACRVGRLSMSETGDFYCEFVFSGRIEVNIVRESERVLAFHHTRPSYPLHIVIVPKAHIPSLLDVEDFSLVQEIFQFAQLIIAELGLQGTNFRILTNGGTFQDSKHLHFHLISSDPPPWST